MFLLIRKFGIQEYRDNIKATVSDVKSYYANLRVLEFFIRPEPFLLPGPEALMASIGRYKSYVGEKISGIRILPLGRFICMLTGRTILKIMGNANG